MKDDAIYITVCKQQIAMNRKLPHEKQIGPLRMSVGKYGKPRRIWAFVTSDAEYVSVAYEPNNPMPWGARAWVKITPKQKDKHELPKRRTRRKNS